MWWRKEKKDTLISREDARPQNYTDGFRQRLTERWSKTDLNLYLIAAAPKSGSTWCAQFLSTYLECPCIFAGKVPGRVEQDLDDIWLSDLDAGQTAVIHQHCRYHQVTEAYIDVLGMKPLPLMRNALDSIPSIRDHLKARGGNWPFGYVDRDILDRSDENIDSFIACHIMPWYFNFAVGWLNSPHQVMTYEQVFRDPKEGAAALLERLNIAADSSRLDKALAQLDGSQTRFNVGIMGRGASLSQTTKDHVRYLAKHYSHQDLGPLGL